MAPEKLGDGHPYTISLDDDLAARYRAVIGHDQDRVVLFRVQFDDGTAPHSEKLVHGDDRATKHDGDLDLDAFDIGGHVLFSRVKSPILSPLWFPRG